MQSSKNTILDRAAVFLNHPSIRARIDKQTLEDISTGRKELFMADFYIRKQLSSVGGIVDIVKEIDSLQPGVTNIDKAKLYPGNYLGLSSIGLSYGYDATEIHPDGISYSNAINGTQVIPIRFVNSDFMIKAGGNLLMKCRTKKFLSHTALEYGIEANDENNLLLKQPKLIPSEKKIEIQIEFPANAPAMASGNHFVEIRLEGLYIGDR